MGALFVLESLFFQVFEFVFDAIPFGGIRRGFLAHGDDWPVARKLGVELDVVFLACRHIIFREDRLGGAFRLTEGAVDALVWVDDEEVRAFVEAIHRADFHAVGVLAFDAIVGHYEGHCGLSNFN